MKWRDPQRRLTCDRQDFENVIGDLASPSAPSSADSEDNDGPGMGGSDAEDSHMGEGGEGRLSPPSREEGSDASSTPASMASR